jgi:class 3 adenylate cyclase
VEEPLSAEILQRARQTTCRTLVYLGFHQLTAPISNLALDLKREQGLGPRTVRGHRKNAEEILWNLERILASEAEVHRIVSPDTEDEKLLCKLHSFSSRFSEEIITRLKNCNKTRGRELQLEQLREIGHRARRIRADLGGHLKRAKERVLELGLTLSTDATVSPGIDQRERSVVSIDMLAYSSHALVLDEYFQGPQGLHQYNRQLQRIFEEALTAAGADLAKTPSFNTGDGALVLLDSAEVAVRFAVEVQKRAHRSNRGVRDASRERRFRIGIATGDICVESKTDRTGAVLSFNAAGIPVIDAVRIQSACEPGAVWISDVTYNKLGKSRVLFTSSDQAPGKEHEERKLSIYKLDTVHNKSVGRRRKDHGLKL